MLVFGVCCCEQGAETLAGTAWESLTGKQPRKNQRKGKGKGRDKGADPRESVKPSKPKLVLQKPDSVSTRLDNDKVGVILSEKRDKKLAKLQAATVPYPFTSREQYERSLRAPVGKEWNTSTTVSYMTKPEVCRGFVCALFCTSCAP